MDYGTYLNEWLKGLKNEISFWDKLMKNRGGQYFYTFEEMISPQKKFQLEEDVPMEMHGKKINFIDVGSGPFSRCGIVSEKVSLNATSVDPLASIYLRLKEKHGIRNVIDLQTGFVELLDKKYPEGAFDIVHMSNALDHSFSAIDGIWQLLRICRVGGIVILRHSENEAEREQYIGLHQWNLSLHNAENSFIIWRGDKRYDICKMFSEYAEFTLYKDQNEGGKWIYNKVVMKKKKECILPENKYYSQMLENVYLFLLAQLYEENERIFYPELDQRLQLIQKNYYNRDVFRKKLIQEGIETVIIYGIGTVGKNLDYLLSESGVNVTAKIDKKGEKCGDTEAITIDQCKSFHVDRMIVTVIDDYEEVYDMLKKYIDRKKIISVNELLDGRKNEPV